MNMRGRWLPVIALLACANGKIAAQNGGTPVVVTGSVIYAQAFSGGGAGVGLQALREMPITFLHTKHSFGLSVWYSGTRIASGNALDKRRTLGGVGVQWEVSIADLANRVRPYVTVPVGLVFSSIPSPAFLTQPQLRPDLVAADRGHERAALSLGVGIGAVVRLSAGVGLRLEGRRLHHGLFKDGNRPMSIATFGLTVGFTER